MQYIVNVPVPDDVAIVDKGRLGLNPKYPIKSRSEIVAETQAMVDSIVQRFSDVSVLHVGTFFAVIDMTEEVAAAVRDELGYDVALNRTRKLP